MREQEDNSSGYFTFVLDESLNVWINEDWENLEPYQKEK